MLFKEVEKMSEQAEKSKETQQASGGSQGVLLKGNQVGIVGLKAGMTQIFGKDGDVTPVTVIELHPNVITQIKTLDKDGYQAVQIGIIPKKTQSCNKAEKGHYKKSGAPGFKTRAEFRVDSLDGLREGAVLLPDFVKEGDFVDVSGVSKGKGFQGGMKRFNMAGGFKTHGASLSHRSLGSIGNRADPAKCFKNKKMPGHMGSENVTVQNLRVVGIDTETSVMLIKGSIPGPKNGVVTIYKAIKNLG